MVYSHKTLFFSSGGRMAPAPSIIVFTYNNLYTYDNPTNKYVP
jgi:hypothetical protein